MADDALGKYREREREKSDLKRLICTSFQVTVSGESDPKRLICTKV
jgi:hypothetical protein